MNTRHLRIVSILCAMVLLLGSANAVTFSGTVSATDSYEVYAPIGGTVESVNVSAGERVEVGDVLATLETTKVYAAEDGVITGIFGEIGDNAATIAERYGAVMYIEGETLYSISASTDEAYNSTENKFVHVGETVYLTCYSHGTHTGTGVITGIQGTDYSVDILSGEFLLGETVSIFRSESTASANRIGRGEVNRKNPTAVSGSGSIVSVAVKNGDSVRKGDLLFETLDGEFDGFYMTGTQITAGISGTVAEVKLAQGSKIEKGGMVAVIYPEGEMRVEAKISEYNLSEIAVGDKVNVELIWNQDEEVNYEGVVSMISAIADEAVGDDDVTYTVYVGFAPDDNTRYGMSALISTMDEIEGGDADEAV